MAVTSDIRQSKRVARSEDRGYELIDTYMVPEATSLVAAMTDEDIPNMGDEHVDLSNKKVINIAAEPHGDGAKVYVTFGSPSGNTSTNDALVTVGASTVQQDVDTTWDDYLMVVSYGGQDRSVSANAMLPQSTVSVTVKSYRSPHALAMYYVGRINSEVWTSFPEAAALTWLCTGIVGQSRDGGETYEVTYTFQFNVDTWDPFLVYIDPETGKRPPDSTGSNGAGTFEIYRTADFNDFGFGRLT